MIEFFMAMEPPTATHQEKQAAIVKGRIRMYEPQRVKDARAKIMAHLGRHRPEAPMEGPLRLVTKWIFPGREGRGHEWKTTKPDTDNMVKLLKDCMTAEGFWIDDAQVASEITEKFLGRPPGIYVRVEELEHGEESETGEA